MIYAMLDKITIDELDRTLMQNKIHHNFNEQTLFMCYKQKRQSRNAKIEKYVEKNDIFMKKYENFMKKYEKIVKKS